MENDMTTDKKVARRKLSLLELASDLGNVSKACRMIGYSRQQFYEIRRNIQIYGPTGSTKIGGRSRRLTSARVSAGASRRRAPNSA